MVAWFQFDQLLARLSAWGGWRGRARAKRERPTLLRIPPTPVAGLPGTPCAAAAVAVVVLLLTPRLLATGDDLRETREE